MHRKREVACENRFPPNSTTMASAVDSAARNRPCPWIAGGDDKYELMHQSLFDVRDKFCDLDVYEMSRSQIYNSLCLATADQVGIELKSLMELLTLDTSNGQRNSGNACTAS